ncbi:allantoinase AllB [Rhodococcus pyridinivorans]|uniref:allantoinase AllB n=1 Tax=Rhodococcus pyridinivorans TaxID=103816 RepID=UPI001FFF227E|nr:allantoinase AllB [Rhodococcus pyridinivorans]UPK63399.1 allantoinase AllB [Rhodococcus pyridinivorans]
MTTVIRARRAVVGYEERSCAVHVRDGRIVAIEEYDGAAPAGAREIVLTDGEVLLPGLVDTHVHVNEPGRTEWEGFATATRAAAAGGVTTIVDMPLNSIPSTVDVAALEVKQKVAAEQVTVDVGFWGGAIPGNLADLEPLWDAGVYGFKCFLAYSGLDEYPPLDREQMIEAMRVIAGFGGLLIVHAEDEPTLDAQDPPAGRRYDDFLYSRPPVAESRAVAQVIDGARQTGCRVHILHLSDAGSLPLVAAAKAEGLHVTAETCPHYLSLFSEEILDGSTHFKCCPPIREAHNREALWRGLADGTLDCIVSDHSPCLPELKKFVTGDFGEAWGGISSLQLGLPIVWSEARKRGHTLVDVVRWMAGRTADLVGLADRGAIAVGNSADLCVFAPDDAFVVFPERLHHRNAVTPYAERALAGVVRQTWLAGEPLTVTLGATDPAPRGALLSRKENR